MTITPTLARMIVAGGLRHLPPEQRERFREECDADLAQLDDKTVRMLVHALQTAAYGRPLRLALGVAPARRSDPLRRRALAHLGFPVRLVEHQENASYVFAGAMRCAVPTEAPVPRTD